MNSRMQSILITGGTSQKRQEAINKLCKDYQIHEIDTKIINADEETTEGGTQIGIELVRHIIRQTMFKPIRGKSQAVIIANVDLLSHPAQNALLKILEEPPQTTVLILTATAKESVLPTILSRCNILSLPTPFSLQLSGEEREQFIRFCQSSSVPKLNELWLLASKINQKAEAQDWIRSLILVAREELLSSAKQHLSSADTLYLRNLLLKAHDTYVMLKTTNMQPRFILETFFLKLVDC